MKKTLIIGMCIIILVVLLVGADQFYFGFNDTTSQNWFAGNDASTKEYVLAQAFNVSHNISLGSIFLYLVSETGASEWYEVRIETDNAGEPSGSLVNVDATKNIDETNLVMASWNNYTFDNPVPLVTNVKYWIIFDANETVGTRFIKISSNAGFSSGNNFSYTYDGGAWTTVAASIGFLLYNVTPPPPPPSTAPNVNVLNPADANWTNDNTPDFVFNVTDSDNATLVCNLTINGTSFGRNASVLNNTLTTITANHSITDNYLYLWNISCTDGTNQSSGARSINIDTTSPTINLLNPLDNNVTTDNTPTFTFNYSDGLSTNASCELIVGSNSRGFNSTTINDTLTSLTDNVSESDGTYIWNVSCTDQANNVGGGTARTIIIDSNAPMVTLNAPPNNSVTTDVTPGFNFTVTDFFSNLSCSLSINGSLRGTNSSVINNTQTIIISNISLVSGTYLWTINCTDIASNIGNGTPRNLTVDTIDLSLPNPDDGVNISIMPMEFNVTANFTFSNTNCTVIVNDSLRQTRTGVGSGTNKFINFSVGGLTNGNNTWFISCFDNYTTENTTERWFMLNLSDTINLSTPNPPSELIINVLPIIFNVTGNFTSDITNCSLYLDGIINVTVYNVSNGTNIFVNYSLDNVSEANHTWLIGCEDLTSSENSTTHWFIFDFQPPVITTNFINNTLVFTNNLEAQFNFTDNLLLHRLNITVDRTTIVFNITHIHADNYSYNLSFNVTGLSVGNHTLFVEISDGHTLSTLKDSEAYNPSNGLFNDYIKYNIKKPYDPITIIIESKEKSILDDWEVINKVDRYSEVFKPNNPGETQTFIVTSTQKIYVVKKNGFYGGEWIITGDHWRDFYLEKEPLAKTKILLLDDYTAEVTITGIKNNPSKLVFDSIGDLNIVNITYNFFVVNMTSTYTTPVNSNVSTTYNLTVTFNNLTFNISGLTPQAILEWNLTNHSASLISFTNESAEFTILFTPPEINLDTNFTFNWHFNLTNLTNGFLSTTNETQLVLNYTGNRINFTIIQLPQNTLLAQQVNLTLTGSTITYNINNITTGNHLAIRLNDDTYHVRAVSGGFIDSVVFVTVSNQTLVNSTIFMSNSTSVVQFTVIDSALDAISNATLSFLQNVNGSFVLVAQGTTDFSGIVQVGLDSTITYNFNVTHSDFALFEGVITPVLTEYTIRLDETGIVFYEAIEEQVGISTEFFYNLSIPNYAISNYTVISLVSPTVLEWYSANTSYNGVFYGGNVSSGTISFNITPINLSAQTLINITYNIRVTGHDVWTWTEYYLLTNVSANITSVTGGLFDVTGMSIAGRVILAMFLVVIIMVAVGAATKSLTAGAIVGMFVLGGTMAGGLIPSLPGTRFNPMMAAITTLIVLGFLIVTDQLVGRVST